MDLSTVVARMGQEAGIEGAMAARAEELYRQYLTLRAKYPAESLVPPKLADEVWHRHILDSKKYEADCRALFGGYLHHTPRLEGEDLSEGWAKTRRLYQAEFGVDVEAFAASNCR